MSIPAFDPKELAVQAEMPNFLGGPAIQVYDFPTTPREAVKALYNKKPIWQVTNVEQQIFSPKVNPDNVARAFVFDGTKTGPVEGGVPDMFGIEWEYVAQVGGSMVRPGKPFMEDANEWYGKLKWPDIDSWDWAGCAEANKEYLGSNKYNAAWFLNGWYERLISFMDFENAIMAIFDEDQKDAVHALFDKLSDLYIRIIDKYLEYFPQIDGFVIHDDWGSQKETFFSPATAAEMIVPYMKRVTDHIHSKGRFCELHSCGQLLKQVPNMIAAGWDSWSGQAMNDTQKIYELYGDKIIIGVIPDQYDTESATEEEQIARAKVFADKFCRADKPSMLNTYGSRTLSPAYRAELYKQSRINYAK